MIREERLCLSNGRLKTGMVTIIIHGVDCLLPYLSGYDERKAARIFASVLQFKTNAFSSVHTVIRNIPECFYCLLKGKSPVNFPHDRELHTLCNVKGKGSFFVILLFIRVRMIRVVI